MAEIITLYNICTRCREPRAKTMAIQQRLTELVFLEVALDRGFGGDRDQLRKALLMTADDLEQRLDGNYNCLTCGKPHGCVFCGAELEFKKGARSTKCPGCGKEFHFVDLEGIKRDLLKQYEEEKLKREKFNSLTEEDFKEIFTGGDGA